MFASSIGLFDASCSRQPASPTLAPVFAPYWPKRLLPTFDPTFDASCSRTLNQVVPARPSSQPAYRFPLAEDFRIEERVIFDFRHPSSASLLRPPRPAARIANARTVFPDNFLCVSSIVACLITSHLASKRRPSARCQNLLFTDDFRPRLADVRIYVDRRPLYK